MLGWPPPRAVIKEISVMIKNMSDDNYPTKKRRRKIYDFFTLVKS